MKKLAVWGISLLVALTLVGCADAGTDDKENGADTTEKIETVVIPEGECYVRKGDTVYFGSWPQSEVTDSGIVSTLNTTAGTLPENGHDGAWTSYDYVVYNGEGTDFMWYQDVSVDGETYRGVYFTSYRPYYTDGSTSTYQDDNGYEENTVYWFVWEPIKWQILTEEEDGTALLLCDMLIDSQEYYDNYLTRIEDGNAVYPNNYAYSNIRAWLSETFYEQAFSDLQKGIIQLTTLDNSAASTGYGENVYACEDTEDKVFLLSQQEATNSEYGFSTSGTYDSARQKKTTDYARCQGAQTVAGGTYDGNGYWWLRSPDGYYPSYACVVRSGGSSHYAYYVNDADYGVCPALWIKL